MSIRFQHLDTLYRKEHVYLFGRALDGRSVAVVQKYSPSIIVNRPLHRLGEMAVRHMCTRVFGDDEEYKRPSVGYLQKQLDDVENPRYRVLRGQDLCAYDETQTHEFYKYTFPNVRMYYAVRSMLSGPVWIATIQGDEVRMTKRIAFPNVEQYNTQVNIGMQYMIENGLMSSGVFEITAQPVQGPTTCQLQFMLPPNAKVTPVDTAEQAPLHILSYDLECNLRTVNGKLVFPVPEVDPIITIGVVTSSGKTVFCLHDVDPIEGVDVHHFHTELDMLIAFNDFVQEYDPDFIIGHNVNRFDNVYYEKRCKQYGDKVQMTWSRLQNYVSVKKIVTQSNQKGTREVFRLDIPGRVVLDSYEKFREDHNLRSYKLDELGKHFLKQQKYDMPYTHRSPSSSKHGKGAPRLQTTAFRTVISSTNWCDRSVRS